MKQQYTYSSFGKIESQSDPNFIQPYTFTSREFDPETGLYFYRARYYDPSIGRFVSEDLLRFLAGDNLYRYVGNNPVKNFDPYGLILIITNIGNYNTEALNYTSFECGESLITMASLARQVETGQIPDKYGHCLAHCKVRKACGWGFGNVLSYGAGFGKELVDWGRGALGRIAERLGFPNRWTRGYNWDWKDIEANERGRTCPLEQSCEDRCRSLSR